jgi:hypothetical protein
VLVTENLKDFPESATAPFGLAVTSQDGFLLDLLDLYPAAVPAALRRQSSRYRREPRTVGGPAQRPGQSRQRMPSVRQNMPRHALTPRLSLPICE